LGALELLSTSALVVAASPASASSGLSPQQLYVTGLYADFLTVSPNGGAPPWSGVACNASCRTTDASGLAYWTPLLGLATTSIPPAASSMATVSAGFVNSAELRNDLVQSDYACLLGRTGDAAGIAYYDALKGANFDNLLPAFLASTEAFSGPTTTVVPLAGSCATAETAATLGGGNFDTWLSLVYGTLLNRAPDAAGRSFYDAQYVKGVSLTSIVNSIVNSTEYETLQINGYYQHFLRRASDAAGLSYYLSLMNHGAGETPEQVMTTITSSTEYWNWTQNNA